MDRVFRRSMERLCWRGWREKTVAGGGCGVGKVVGYSEDHLTAHESLPCAVSDAEPLGPPSTWMFSNRSLSVLGDACPAWTV